MNSLDFFPVPIPMQRSKRSKLCHHSPTAEKKTGFTQTTLSIHLLREPTHFPLFRLEGALFVMSTRADHVGGWFSDLPLCLSANIRPCDSLWDVALVQSRRDWGGWLDGGGRHLVWSDLSWVSRHYSSFRRKEETIRCRTRWAELSNAWIQVGRSTDE